MRKWFYLHVSWIWVIFVFITISLIAFVLYKITSSDTFEVLTKLLMLLSLIVMFIGMIGFGVWGEDKIEEMNKKNESDSNI